MSCCFSTKKKQASIKPKSQIKKTKQDNYQHISNNQIVYNASGSKINQQHSGKFKTMNTLKISQKNHVYREQDYAKQNNEVTKSKLYEPNSIMNYKLDIEDGVACIPIVNTFTYGTILNHHYPVQKGDLMEFYENQENTN